MLKRNAMKYGSKDEMEKTEMGKINERPSWCPHENCLIFRCFQDTMCSGRLPEPVPHGTDFNDSRICLRHALPNDEIFDLQINKSDTYWFKLLFEVTGDKLKKTYSRETVRWAMDWAFEEGIHEGKLREEYQDEASTMCRRMSGLEPNKFIPSDLDWYIKMRNGKEDKEEIFSELRKPPEKFTPL